MLAFVIMRDRVTYARRCVAALEAAGLDVVIVDHGSTWPEALRWLNGLDERSNWGVRDGQGDWAAQYPRIDWHENRHPRDLWRERDEDRPGLLGPIRAYTEPDERFVVTDCDVVPADDCPADWLAYLGTLLDEYPAAVKAGLGLRTDDLPPWFARRDEVRLWEATYQPGCARPVGSWSAVWADIDTTLALYRRPGPFRLGPAIRTTAPYEALHLPWYEDTANLPEEIKFYNSRAEHGHWRNPDGFEDTHGISTRE